jgi:hypothetical protein
MPRPRKPANQFRYFHSSPEVIRLVVMLYERFALSLRNVEDLLFERGIDVCQGDRRQKDYIRREDGISTLSPMFAAELPLHRSNCAI